MKINIYIICFFVFFSNHFLWGSVDDPNRKFNNIYERMVSTDTAFLSSYVLIRKNNQTPEELYLKGNYIFLINNLLKSQVVQAKNMADYHLVFYEKPDLYVVILTPKNFEEQYDNNTLIEFFFFFSKDTYKILKIVKVERKDCLCEQPVTSIEN